MLDIKWIRENPEALVTALIKRGASDDAARFTVEKILDVDESRRAHLGELQLKQERRNAASKEIGNAMRSGDMVRAEELKLEVNEIKTFLSSAEAREREIDIAMLAELAVIPNLPLEAYRSAPTNATMWNCARSAACRSGRTGLRSISRSAKRWA